MVVTVVTVWYAASSGVDAEEDVADGAEDEHADDGATAPATSRRALRER